MTVTEECAFSKVVVVVVVFNVFLLSKSHISLNAIDKIVTTDKYKIETRIVCSAHDRLCVCRGINVVNTNKYVMMIKIEGNTTERDH